MADPDVALAPPGTAVREPGAPAAAEAQRIFVASQWQLMWWRFRKHKLAVASGIVVLGFYMVVIFADFLAYADPNASEAQRSLMPPQAIHWFEGWRFRPHVYALKGARDPVTFKRVYRADPNDKIPIRFGIAVIMPAAAIYAGLVLHRRIDEVQQRIGVNVSASSLPEGDPRRVAFGKLHGQSALVQFVPIVGGLLLLFWELGD